MYRQINCGVRYITANKEENKQLGEIYQQKIVWIYLDGTGKPAARRTQRRQIIPDFPCNGTTHTFLPNSKQISYEIDDSTIHLMIQDDFSSVDWNKYMTAAVISNFGSQITLARLDCRQRRTNTFGLEKFTIMSSYYI